MQKKLILKTTDKKTIYGTLATPKGKSKGLIIFIHGLTRNQEEHIFVNGSKYFTNQWYSTYRFNLYGEGKNARKLETTSLKNHIQDTNTVITYFQKQWIQKIFLVGHSFGGLTILYSQVNKVSWIILWDSSIWGKGLLSDVSYNKKSNTYIIDRWEGLIYTVNKTMYKDFCIDPKNHLEKIKKIHVPIKIICAEKWLKKWGKKYYKVANKPKDFIVISGASHCFHEKGTEEQLFKETYTRIKKYS